MTKHQHQYWYHCRYWQSSKLSHLRIVLWTLRWLFQRVWRGSFPADVCKLDGLLCALDGRQHLPRLALDCPPQEDLFEGTKKCWQFGSGWKGGLLFKNWHSSILKYEGEESNQRETSRTWEDKQPWDSGIPSFLSVFFDVEAIVCNQLGLVLNYLPGAGALYHLDLPLVLPEAKVHHRLGRLLQRVPAATFIYHGNCN